MLMVPRLAGCRTTPPGTTNVQSLSASTSYSAILVASSPATSSARRTLPITSSDVSSGPPEPRQRLRDNAFADGLELLFIALGLVLTPITVLIYMRINARRDVLQQEASEKGIRYDPEEIRRLGDRAPDFRYTL